MAPQQFAFYRTAHPLSNFHQTAFEMDGNLFPTAEHGLMFCKATLFGDTKIANEILSATTPAAAKALGRKIVNFDDAVWKTHREDVMEKVLYAKFDQGKKVREQLMSYPLDAEFVEASPSDRIWGVGRSERDLKNGLPPRGLNLLGKCIGRVKARLHEERGLCF